MLNDKLCQLITKVPKYRETKPIQIGEAGEEIQTDIDQFIEKIPNEKRYPQEPFYSMERSSYFVSS